MLSASNEADDKTRSLDVGVDDYLVKPVPGKVMDAYIRLRLAYRAKLRELAEQAEAPLSVSTPRAPEVVPESGRGEGVDRAIHFLVADGNASRRAHMSEQLSKLGAVVTPAASERAALAAMEKPELDGVMLWSTGPHGDDSRALALCSEMRARAPDAAILLVCRNLETPSVAVAEAGADLAFPEHTPMSAMWFAAGVCVHKRRAKAGVVDLGRVQILLDQPFVVVDGDHRKLGFMEHKLVVVLARHYPGRQSARQLRDLLGYPVDLSPGDSNPLSQTMRRLKKHLVPYGEMLTGKGIYGLLHTDELSGISGTRAKQRSGEEASPNRDVEPSEPERHELAASKPERK